MMNIKISKKVSVKQREIINFELESMCYENDWFNG